MRWFLALTLAFVALIAVPLPASGGDLEEGRELLAEGRYEEAAEKFRAVTEADPESFDGWLGLAETQLGLGKGRPLTEAAEKARDLNRESAVAWVLAGKGYYLQADALAQADGAGMNIRLLYADAKRCAERALDIDAKAKGAHYVLAKAALGIPDEADSVAKGIEHYEAETAVAPENIDAWFQLGTLLFRNEKEYGRAAKAFQGCVKADRDHGLGWKWLGSSLEYAGVPDQAVTAYAQAIRVDPTDQYALNRLFELVRESDAGRKAAIEAYETMVEGIEKRTPENTFPVRMLGWLYQQAGRQAEAVKLLEGLVDDLPKNPAALTALGDAYKATGELERALGLWKRAVELDPATTKSAYDSIWAARINDPATLEWLFAQRENGFVANNLGLIHRDVGNTEKSLQWYLKAVELEPNDAGILNDTGVIYHYYLKKPKKALPYYERAIEAAKVQYAEQIAAGETVIPLRDARNNKRAAEKGETTYRGGR